jgi:hypothetical protein
MWRCGAIVLIIERADLAGLNGGCRPAPRIAEPPPAIGSARARRWSRIGDHDPPSGVHHLRLISPVLGFPSPDAVDFRGLRAAVSSCMAMLNAAGFPSLKARSICPPSVDSCHQHASLVLHVAKASLRGMCLFRHEFSKQVSVYMYP